MNQKVISVRALVGYGEFLRHVDALLTGVGELALTPSAKQAISFLRSIESGDGSTQSHYELYMELIAKLAVKFNDLEDESPMPSDFHSVEIILRSVREKGSRFTGLIALLMIYESYQAAIRPYLKSQFSQAGIDAEHSAYFIANDEDAVGSCIQMLIDGLAAEIDSGKGNFNQQCIPRTIQFTTDALLQIIGISNTIPTERGNQPTPRQLSKDTFVPSAAFAA